MDAAMGDAASGGAIRTVLVAGNGLTGWCAAAALRRHAPFLRVMIAGGPAPAGALADRIVSALPSLLAFQGDLGIGLDDAVARTGSGYRLGTAFAGWNGDRADFVHAYGRHGTSFGPTSFHLHWIRAAREGRALPFDAFSLAATLARADRFVPPGTKLGPPFGTHDHGLTLDLARYRAMMRAFALHAGAEEVDGDVVDSLPDERGLIGSAVLADGRRIAADLFVDTTGPAAVLRSALPGARDDWSRWLPCDRVLIADGPAPESPPVLDRVTAVGAGWRWSTASPTRASHGIAYASAFAADATAARQLRVATGAEAEGDPIRVAAGTRRDPWAGNCIAIGDAATEVEPLEWCNFHLALSGIDRLIAMLPDRDCAPVELANYNRQALAEAERVRDFLALHYAVAKRPEPFWRAIAATRPPASLAHTLALFRERGRLPFYEEETFSRDSWAAVLLGQGVLPRRIDPLVEAVPERLSRETMAAFRGAVERALPTFPTHAAVLAEQTRRAAR
ncbi:MAG: tryptophan 7-halogenase [Janthinobacterium lividum]